MKLCYEDAYEIERGNLVYISGNYIAEKVEELRQIDMDRERIMKLAPYVYNGLGSRHELPPRFKVMWTRREKLITTSYSAVYLKIEYDGFLTIEAASAEKSDAKSAIRDLAHVLGFVFEQAELREEVQERLKVLFRSRIESEEFGRRVSFRDADIPYAIIRKDKPQNEDI